MARVVLSVSLMRTSVARCGNDWPATRTLIKRSLTIACSSGIDRTVSSTTRQLWCFLPARPFPHASCSSRVPRYARDHVLGGDCCGNRSVVRDCGIITSVLFIAQSSGPRKSRPLLFLCDECQQICSAGDAQFFDTSRALGVIGIVARSRSKPISPRSVTNTLQPRSSATSPTSSHSVRPNAPWSTSPETRRRRRLERDLQHRALGPADDLLPKGRLGLARALGLAAAAAASHCPDFPRPRPRPGRRTACRRWRGIRRRALGPTTHRRRSRELSTRENLVWIASPTTRFSMDLADKQQEWPKNRAGR